MTGVAEILFGHARLIVPSRTAYDRQLLFEQIAHAARRYGRARITLRDLEWTVAAADLRAQPCSICHERPGKLSYTRLSRTLCHPCACRVLN